jgi:hypothetical protein
MLVAAGALLLLLLLLLPAPDVAAAAAAAWTEPWRLPCDEGPRSEWAPRRFSGVLI